jgi:predicted GIY-YIG superfamily endonuclease
MYVYFLSNNKTPTIPFYVGITTDPSRRFYQHKNNWTKHKPYITHPHEFQLHIICDTGENEQSTTLAEKIETNLIRYYNTVNCGSNKVYDITSVFTKLSYKLPKNSEEYKNRQLKAKETIRKKKHKKFKQILKYIHEDPCSYTKEQVIQQSKFKKEQQLNRYMKQYHNQTFGEWFEKYKQLWLIKHNLN